MRQLLINIFFFLVAILVFWLAAPEMPASNTNPPVPIIKEAPTDTASIGWEKTNLIQLNPSLRKLAY